MTKDKSVSTSPAIMWQEDTLFTSVKSLSDVILTTKYGTGVYPSRGLKGRLNHVRSNRNEIVGNELLEYGSAHPQVLGKVVAYRDKHLYGLKRI